MNDYKEIARTLLLEWFSPEPQAEGLVIYTTTELLVMVRGLLPQHPLDEHDIYEIMHESGFRNTIIRRLGTDSSGTSIEFEQFAWLLYATQEMPEKHRDQDLED